MKSKTTALWFVIALVLAGSVWLSQTYFQHAPPAPASLLPGLRAAEVTAIQVSPAGTHEIAVVRTNQTWLLTEPVTYPADSAAIVSLLGALEKLTATTAITATEMSGHKNADAEFGFDDPQYTVDVTAGEQTWHLRVGNKTAPGDGVYVRVVGLNGAFVTDPGWLQWLPHDPTSWRDTALVDTDRTVDWLVITNGAKVIELRSDATNHVWRMIRPLQARADGARIATALQLLRSASVSKFVTDDPKADLTTYGLQPAGLDVWLGHGTDLLTAIHAGKDDTDNPADMYVQRQGWGSVLTTAKQPLSPWRSAVNDWRDRHLLDLTAPIAGIDVRGENGFTLQQQPGSTNWMVVGEKFPTDLDEIQQFVRLLASLRVTDFVKDFVTGTDLQDFGLTTNSHQIILFGAAGDTNNVLSRLIFGAATTNEIYVKRGDEDFVYGLSLDQYNQLPEYGWQFRDRRIWNFSETNVTQVTLHQDGRTLSLLRLGKDAWSLAAGSQGMINPPAVEEVVHRLGQLTCDGWIGRDITSPEKYGLGSLKLQIVIELRTGEKLTVDFGEEIPHRQTVVGGVTLDGGRWAFVFPPPLLALVVQYLTIPPAAQ
jgi:hypothetical protein